MKKAFALLLIVSSLLVVGCGSDEVTGNKVPLNSNIATPADQAGKGAGKARMSPMLAPSGVKTGTPGG